MWRASERANAESMRRACEERMWGVCEEWVCEWEETACGLCVRCVWRVCVSERETHSSVYEWESTGKEKHSVQENAECVQPWAESEWAREKESREWQRRETLSLEKLSASLYPKSSLCIFIMYLPDIPASSWELPSCIDAGPWHSVAPRSWDSELEDLAKSPSPLLLMSSGKVPTWEPWSPWPETSAEKG